MSSKFRWERTAGHGIRIWYGWRSYEDMIYDASIGVDIDDIAELIRLLEYLQDKERIADACITADCPTDAQRLAELEGAMANLLGEMETLRGSKPLTKPHLIWTPKGSEVEAQTLLDIGVLESMQSSQSVLREQVRELTGDVEKLRRGFLDPSGLVLQDNVTTITTREHKCPYCGTVTHPVIRDNVTTSHD